MKNEENHQETHEWIESLAEVLDRAGSDRAVELLNELRTYSLKEGVPLPFTANTPYTNTIASADQKVYPGRKEIEYRLSSIIRWNAMAMVVKANREEHGIGGHISTYASASVLYEVAFNHFLRGNTAEHTGDMVYYQGHASPGIYARAFMEGRIPIEKVNNFRHELHDTPGLSSYPHPWLMPEFWKFPTVSMGLGPITSIYHARFMKYLEDRGLSKPSDRKIWAFLGDGETDEPESLGALTLASREKLDNLIFVINCNLQRLDGPVRGNGKIIQELEAAFKGAGWNVIKVVWGSEWDDLLTHKHAAILLKRMEEIVDGQYQKYVVEGPEYFRKDFFGSDERLIEMIKDYSDDDLQKLIYSRGGLDPEKVFNAYAKAVNHQGQPTVILAKTIKGYGMGEGGEGMNITHNQKVLNEKQLLDFRNRFSIPISDKDVDNLPFFRPPEDSEEIKYLLSRRETLGGFNPKRFGMNNSLKTPDKDIFQEFVDGTGNREVSTTMAYVRILSKLLEDPEIGKFIVPIVPDEARTFGMESLFRQCGIYSHPGQLYEPVDRTNLLYYKEITDGQIIEEGITEAGALSSFIAAGTAYSNHGVNTIPFYTFYSMFGFQRICDLAWAAADARCKGFLVGATAGRTTLAGEGLQHQDGNTHLMAMTIPNLKAYDPAYAYEISCIIRDGIKRMYTDGEDIYYYLTVMNENYVQPKMPKGVEEGIIKGLYLFKKSDLKDVPQVQLFGSGAILNEAVKAQEILSEKFQVAADIWSVTSYKELYDDALDCERWNRLHPTKGQKKPYLESSLEKSSGPFIAASDYVKAVPLSISKWIPGKFTVLGTDGFGRSDGRGSLREFFEVNAENIVVSALQGLCKEGKVQARHVEDAIKDFGIATEEASPRLR